MYLFIIYLVCMFHRYLYLFHVNLRLIKINDLVEGKTILKRSRTLSIEEWNVPD